jgi:hypothetical protein
MPARFTQGASIKATRTISQADKVAPPQKNTMKGLPGFIRTTMDRSSGGLASAKPVGPRFTVGTSLATTSATKAFRKSQGAYIGKRGGSGAANMDSAKFRGSSDKSYRATSTGPAGKIASNKGTPESRGAKESEGKKRGKPTSGFKQTAGGRGTMESLRGRARTSWER